MSNPASSSPTPLPVQAAPANPVNQITRSRAAAASYPRAVADPDLAAGGGGTLQQHGPAAVWWDAQNLADSPFGAEMRPPSGRDVPSAWSNAQLTVLLALTTGPGRGVQAMALVSGEMDIATVPALRTAARAVARAAHPHPGQAVVLVLDLEGVTFLDSSGLHLLEDLHAEGIEQGWDLHVLPPAAPAPCRLLRLAASRDWLPLDLVQDHPLPRPRPDGPSSRAAQGPAKAA